jgi:hypothetical protein
MSKKAKAAEDQRLQTEAGEEHKMEAMTFGSGEVIGAETGRVIKLTCTNTAGEPVPFFLLRADRHGHLRALMAALQELPGEMSEGLRKLREFDLYEETHR